MPAPAAAPASRNSRRVSMEPPQAKKQEPQGQRLDEMVQRVVIEVPGMQRDPRLLRRGGDEDEAEPRDADRDQGEAPENRVPQGAGVEEETVDRSSGERRDGGRPEEQGVLSPLEQIGEDGALERERIVREGDVRLGHPAAAGRVW